jgi:type III secretion system-like peptide-binding chaperone
MPDHPFAGTAAIVRRALDRHYAAAEPGDAVWQGRVGPEEVLLRADVVALEGSTRPLVRMRATAAEHALDGALARAIATEQDGLPVGRLEHDGRVALVAASLLGGPTLDLEECISAAYAVATGAAATGPRLSSRLAGQDPGALDLEPDDVSIPRDADERLARAEGYVERLLVATYGEFTRDPSWGYNGPFGSARVFVDVRPFLGESTVVRVASPVLSQIELDDALALRVLELAAASPLGRFSYLGERRELWFEHALLGDALDPDELELAVGTIARVADGEDDALAAAFGGLRYADLTAG